MTAKVQAMTPNFNTDFGRKLAALKMPVPTGQIKQREGWRDKQGNPHFVDYVEWHTVADILDEIAPKWSHSVRDIREIGDILTVTVAITIDGITREGIGTGAVSTELGIKKAEHDALKRAAVKFGIARELYKKETEIIEREGAADFHSADKPRNPVARGMNDFVTAKQLGMIRGICRELNLDPDEECVSEIDCRIDELSRRVVVYRTSAGFAEGKRDIENGLPRRFRQHQGFSETTKRLCRYRFLKSFALE